MYRNIKLVEDFEQGLKNLLKEDTQQDFSSFVIDLQEESKIIESTPSLRKIVNELSKELDDDSDEDFNGDGEDDIDPDELDHMYLGPDEEVKDLEDDDDDIDPDELDDAFLGADEEVKDLTDEEDMDKHDEDVIKEDSYEMELQENMDDLDYLYSLDEDVNFNEEEDF